MLAFKTFALREIEARGVGSVHRRTFETARRSCRVGGLVLPVLRLKILLSPGITAGEFRRFRKNSGRIVVAVSAVALSFFDIVALPFALHLATTGCKIAHPGKTLIHARFQHTCHGDDLAESGRGPQAEKWLSRFDFPMTTIVGIRFCRIRSSCQSLPAI